LARTRFGLLRARIRRLQELQQQVVRAVDPSVCHLVKDEVNAWLLRGNTEEVSGGDTVAAGQGTDANEQVCSKCAGVGSLLCCDLCPNAFHLSCISMLEHEVPEGIWACPECVAAGMASIPENTFLDKRIFSFSEFREFILDFLFT
jgi:hypothetical protein